MQAQPLRWAAIPVAPWLSQEPGCEGACRDREGSDRSHPTLPTPCTSPHTGSEPWGLWISLCQYSLKSWMAAFLMAQQGEPRPRSARAIMGVAWHSTAPPSPAPRTSVCSTWRAHTWGEHRGSGAPSGEGVHATMPEEEGRKTQGSQKTISSQAARLDSVTRAVDFCPLSSHSLTLGTWHSSLQVTQQRSPCL